MTRCCSTYPKALALLLLLSVLFLMANEAVAQRIATRKVGYRLQDSHLLVTFGYKDIFSPKVKDKLKSGLPTRVVLQIAVENESGKQVAYWARTIRVVYDLWEEQFVVTLKEPGGKRATRVKTIREVLHAGGVLRRTPIASHLPSGKYRVKVGIEANPVSEKMIKNIQRWISKPSGGFQNTGSGTSYFGSFVGYFVDRNIAKAEKSIRFVSQWLEI